MVQVVYKVDRRVIKESYVIVIGNGNTIYGDFVIVIGNNCVVFGKHCIAHGDHNRLEGNFATCIGKFNTIIGERGTAFGDGNRVMGPDPLVRGTQCHVVGTNPISIGMGNKLDIPMEDVSFQVPRVVTASHFTDDNIKELDSEPVEGVQFGICIVCMTNRVKCVMYPCAHLATCVGCAHQMEKDAKKHHAAVKCPVCREPVEKLDIIYFV